MLRMRLRRVGKKKQPMYRIVVADSTAPRDGAFVESIGYYHPMDEPSTIVLDEERAKHWLEKGASPSMRVAKILKIQGLAELSPKHATRVALGEQRKAEAGAAKQAAAAETKAEAEQPAAEAATPTEEAAAEEAPAQAAEAETPTEKAAEEAPAEAEEAKAEAETPAEDAAETSDDEKSEE